MSGVQRRLRLVSSSGRRGRLTKKERKQLATVQDLIGHADNCHGNDRDPNGFENGQKALRKAFQIVVEMLSKYPPEEAR